MSRGVLYIVWKGSIDFAPALDRSIASLKRWHPGLEIHVQQMALGSNLLCKAGMHELSPFDETLFLDADTVVLGNLDFGFEKARQHGMAVTICNNPWARRYAGLRNHGDLIEYDTGVIFFRKNFRWVDKFFTDWQSHAGTHDSSSHFRTADGIRGASINDQCSFAAAMNDANRTGNLPFVLPVNWNVHPRWQKTFWGEMKIWHAYETVPDQLKLWNERQRTGTVIECGSLP